MSLSTCRACFVVALSAATALVSTAGQGSGDLDPTLQKLGGYVASYGEQASVVVAVEKYSQRVTTETTDQSRPRQLVAEFAIVKTAGGWTGFRDVVEVDGQRVAERGDRLLKIFTDATATESEITRIANESARYNVGPVATNVNLPTTTLFFFQPENLPRFVFTRAGKKKIDGTETVEYTYKEVKSPTLVRRRDGRDVPLEGKLWIVAENGTVVRTWMRLRGFADIVSSTEQQAPSQRPAVNPNTPTGGREALARAASSDPMGQRELKSVADIEVTYKRDNETGLWLPAEMSEVYEGPIKLGTKPPFEGMSTTRARYSDFKRFGTGARVNIPKNP